MTFSANSDVGATLGASAHLIPQVSLGLKALGASASVSLDLDASLGLQGSIASVANPQPCLTGNADINVGVGAEGSFFGLFDASTGKSLFEKNFPLFQVRAHWLTKYIFFRVFIILSTRRQKCFAGKSNSTNSTSPSSTTNSASQTSATNSSSQTSKPRLPHFFQFGKSATTTDSASQTSATDVTSTDSASQTSATDATTTNPASQTSATDATATDSASQTSATDATASDSNTQANSLDATAAAPDPRRHYENAPRAVRHSARLGRSYHALHAQSHL